MGNSLPLVSIIMSAYNSQKWLQMTIDSVLQQTYNNWQFIIIEDASTDNTKLILNNYLADCRFVIKFQPKNVGYVKNLNYALQFCEGKYIARLDADDICVPTRLEKQVAFLETNIHVDLVATFINFIDEKNGFIGVWNNERKCNTEKKIRSMMPFENCIAHPSIMIKAEVLKQYKYNEFQKNSEDWDLWLHLLSQNKIISKIPETLLLYRKLSTSVTSISLKQSVFAKNNFTYKTYLRSVIRRKDYNSFNVKILIAFGLNFLKLILSKSKRFFYHS